jgi:hypothetical protein
VDDIELLQALRDALSREEELRDAANERAERYANAIFALTSKPARMTVPWPDRHNFQVSPK